MEEDAVKNDIGKADRWDASSMTYLGGKGDIFEIEMYMNWAYLMTCINAVYDT
jgi:hypothetical protein